MYIPSNFISYFINAQCGHHRQYRQHQVDMRTHPKRASTCRAEIIDAGDLALCAWSARSPDFTVCDFFLWEYAKNKVYTPPLPANIDDMRVRITAAINTVDRNMLWHVWDEFSNRLDVVRAACGGHIEHR